jgi:hypothetical protein
MFRSIWTDIILFSSLYVAATPISLDEFYAAPRKHEFEIR